MRVRLVLMLYIVRAERLVDPAGLANRAVLCGVHGEDPHSAIARLMLTPQPESDGSLRWLTLSWRMLECRRENGTASFAGSLSVLEARRLDHSRPRGTGKTRQEDDKQQRDKNSVEDEVDRRADGEKRVGLDSRSGATAAPALHWQNGPIRFNPLS